MMPNSRKAYACNNYTFVILNSIAFYKHISVQFCHYVHLDYMKAIKLHENIKDKKNARFIMHNNPSELDTISFLYSHV